MGSSCIEPQWLRGCHGCTQAPASASLTDPDIERMTLQMTGHPLASGHAQGVREMLATMRFKGKVDPDVQPSVAFDPEVDVE